MRDDRDYQRGAERGGADGYPDPDHEGAAPRYAYDYELDAAFGYADDFEGPSAGQGELIGRGEHGRAYEAPYAGDREPRGPVPAGARRGRPRARIRSQFHGYGMGYGGGALRSRGSFQAGQLRSGLNPEDEFEFDWGEGYVGGRGYAGTNYDLQHGYRVGSLRAEARRGWGPPPLEGDGGRTTPGREETSHERGAAARGPSGDAAIGAATGAGTDHSASRAGYEWGREREHLSRYAYGPARYGYGPYHQRLQRRRRSDDEVREEVEETLFYDTWVDADRIQVSVRDAVVTLSGTLPSYDEVRYATDDAWNVDGVRGVRSELSVPEREPAAEGD